ncbi:MAG: tRNA pseudouridine(55) synthase TruB [Thermodesulfobacteriota bacterium]
MAYDVNGAVIVDKPPGVTSAGLIARIKKMTMATKVGHTGTLDPFATGVMICCFNQATRLSRFFLSGGKKYLATMILGVTTDTQDATGQVLTRSDPGRVTEADILGAFSRFTGEISQQPPVYSALKHGGVPLYKLARKGMAVEKPPRKVTIRSIRPVAMELPEIHFEVACSGGTYIRTLCADIGEALGCGGHLKSLRRTESGGFSIDGAVDMAELETLALSGKLSDKLVRMSAMLSGMEACVADSRLAEKIRHGIPIGRRDLAGGTVIPAANAEYAGYIKLVDGADDLLAVVEIHPDEEPLRYCCVVNEKGLIT